MFRISRQINLFRFSQCIKKLNVKLKLLDNSMSVIFTFEYYCICRGARMSDIRGNKEVARQLILDLKCFACNDVPGFAGVRRNRYICSKGHLVCEQGSIYGRRDHCHSEYDQKHSEPEISKIL